MRIKQVAELTGVPTSTIRYHEKQGLLPKANRNINGYRNYTEQDIDKIQMIKYCQSLGFDLKEMQVLLNDELAKDHQAILERLSQKKIELQKIIDQMTIKRSQIDHLYNVLSENWTAGNCLTQQQIKALVKTTEQQLKTA
jgi:MerR family copper efflux transcriptional regulator